jgi:lysozyme
MAGVPHVVAPKTPLESDNAPDGCGCPLFTGELTIVRYPFAGPAQTGSLMSVHKQHAPTHLSESGARFIGRFEGFRAHLYNDAAGHCTIGYGHLVHHGPCNGSEPGEFKRGLSEQAAEELLRKDAHTAADAVRGSVHVPLNQAQFDALVSFVYNLGAGAFESSTLLKDINAHNFAAVPGQLEQWVHAGAQVLPGLVARRKAEARLFRAGEYS